MEPSQFDEFTKAMATPTSRRKALKGLAVGTAASLLTLGGLGKVFAKTCPAGLTNCGGKCVNLKNDPKHCGDCNVVCPSGVCINGLCCPSGALVCSTSSGPQCCTFTCCGGVHEQVCVDTEHDPNNCGGCGNVCPAGNICKNGKCIVQACSNPGCETACPTNDLCGCVTTTEGSACVIPICTFVSCTSSADCSSDEVCFTQGCCGSGSFCVPKCSSDGAPIHAKHGAARVAWH